MAEFVMPSLGSDMEAGTLIKWRRGVGDRVARGDILAEVETDKGIIEVETFNAGVVEKLVATPGTRVPVGTVLAIIGSGEATVTAPPSSAPPTPPRASPAARKRAHELNVDLASVVPSSERGVISIADIERAAAAVASTQVAAAVPADARMRRAIAATMARAKREIPHFYLMRTIDLAPATHWLEQHNESLPPEARVVLGALLCRAVARAARRVPELNARWSSDEAVLIPDVNVGVAISLRNGGLVAPAIKNADQLSVDELMHALADVSTRARAGTLRSSEMSDATITLTSLGERGVDQVFPIIFPPQVAMVGAGVPRVRPWVVDGGLFARPLVDVTIAVDHRVTDGHRASRFLLEMEKALLEEP